MPYLLTLLIHLQGHPLVDKDQFNENVKLTINMKVQFISSIISLKFKFATDGKGRNKTPGDKVSEDWTSLEVFSRRRRARCLNKKKSNAVTLQAVPVTTEWLRRNFCFCQSLKESLTIHENRMRKRCTDYVQTVHTQYQGNCH